ncbi:hypothetical protein JL721_4886 [Aureococcus anophagefferens]|nr:hypothetical protein JL721_4886 [Aureococcus anophagefferens]
MARRLAVVVALATTSLAATTNVSRTDTSWWRRALALPALVPDFDIIATHICGMPALVESRTRSIARSRARTCWASRGPTFRNGAAAAASRARFSATRASTASGISAGRSWRRSKRPGIPRAPRFFGQSASVGGVYLRDVAGLGDGFAPSLYCHERAHVKRAFDARKNSGCRPADEFRAFFTARYPAGAALFRDHFECFATPPFDAWFGFDALPAADDPAWEGRAVAETYASLDRGAFAGGCGAAAGAARLAIHARLGDLLATAGPAEGRRLRRALVVAAALAAAPGSVHVLVLSDSPAAAVAGCAGYMKSWWGDMGVDEIFRCVECCRPWHAKDVVKMRAQAVARAKQDRAAEAARADDAPVIEASEGGFDMSDLDDVLERED